MNNDMFAELEASLREGMAILRGEVPPARIFEYDIPDVKAIRQNLNLTQNQFAALMGISVRTLQNWEQRRRSPEGPARVLLMVAAKHPQAVLDTVQEGSRKKVIYHRAESALDEIRADAAARGLDEMTMEEVDAEIRAYRVERHARRVSEQAEDEDE